MTIYAQEALGTTMVTERPLDHKSQLQPSRFADDAIPAILDPSAQPPCFGSWLVVEVAHPENVYLAFRDVLLVEGIDGQWRAWMRLDGAG